jgi:multiple antibiotic resistance protein
VAVSGWKLLNDNSQDSSIPTQVAKTYDEDLPDEEIKARSFYPMSFPLTVGPGTIAASITLGANTPTRLLDWVISVGSAALGAALTALVIFLCYNYAHKLVNLMGRLGTMVVLRLSAFILLCIGSRSSGRGCRRCWPRRGSAAWRRNGVGGSWRDS